MTATWRTTFETPRSGEYFNEGGLRALIGHEKPSWPLVLIKELCDNSLDSCESVNVAPEITVTVDVDSFSVSDNGPGLNPDTIKRSLNYDTRISDKKWYISPSRGQLGSALKTLWPACYVATGQRGVVEIESCGVHHTITAYGGAIKSHDQEPATVRNGTFIRVHWPQIACQLTHDRGQLFYRGDMSYPGRMDEVVVDVVRDFAAGNPHSAFSVTAGGTTSTFSATDTEWRKWRVSDRGSAHWYSVVDVKNLLTAHHNEEKRLDELGANTRRLTLRDVLADFDGLKGTVVRKRVLEQAGLTGMTLDDVFEGDDGFVATVTKSLLDAARANTRVVKPERLGLIGTEHMGKTLAAYGATGDFVSRYLPGFDGDGLPFLVEAAFGIRKERSRKIIFAVNNSIVFQVPSQHISETLMTTCRVESHDPVVLVVHMTCPKFNFTSQGKNSLVMTSAMQELLDKLLVNITKKHTKNKKSEAARKHRDAITDRQIEESMERDRIKEEKDEIKAAAFAFMAKAYRQASEPHNTAGARQVMYQCRPMVLGATGGKCWKNYGYFSRLLLDYQEQHEDECADWHVEYDARGHFREPHGGKFFGIGTAEVRDYIDSWMDGSNDEIGSLHIESKFPTSGPLHRFQAGIYVEKEGFDDLLARSGIAQLYDAAIFSCKGMSVSAARKLVDEISQAGVTVFVLHDFDRSGMLINHWLSHDSRRHEFAEQPNVIDIGLRLADVKRLKLESESVEYEQKKHPADRLLELCEDITDEEIDFLVSKEQHWDAQTQRQVWSGRRVELNAMTSKQFISFIERKLDEHNVRKVVPNQTTLKIAWRRAEKIRLLNAAIDEAMERVNEKGATRTMPRDLATQVREMLRRKPLMPWDSALAQIAKKGKKL